MINSSFRMEKCRFWTLKFPFSGIFFLQFLFFRIFNFHALSGFTLLRISQAANCHFVFGEPNGLS